MSYGMLCLKKAAANGLIILKEMVLNPFEAIFASAMKSGLGCSPGSMCEGGQNDIPDEGRFDRLGVLGDCSQIMLRLSEAMKNVSMQGGKHGPA